MLKRLQQVVIEDRYARRNIRANVFAELNAAEVVDIRAMVTAVNTYLNKGDYYNSKQFRVDHVNNTIDTEDIIKELLVIMLSVNGEQTIQSVASKLGSLFMFDDVFDNIKTASEILAVCAIADDFIDIIHAKNSSSGSIQVKSNYMFDTTMQQYISNTKYLPPMICCPQHLKTNRDSGYITQNDSVVLGNGNEMGQNQDLNTLNKVNSVKMSLDTYILDNFRETSRFKKEAHGQQILLREESFERMVKASEVVYKELLEQGNLFYFCNKYDKRGRMYSQGYHVNIQSTEYKKALINLNKQVVIEGI